MLREMKKIQNVSANLTSNHPSTGRDVDETQIRGLSFQVQGAQGVSDEWVLRYWSRSLGDTGDVTSSSSLSDDLAGSKIAESWSFSCCVDVVVAPYCANIGCIKFNAMKMDQEYKWV